MKIIIDCSEIGIASLLEAVQNKANEYEEKRNSSNWAELQRYYYEQERILYDILTQIAKNVNGRTDKNDS